MIFSTVNKEVFFLDVCNVYLVRARYICPQKVFFFFFLCLAFCQKKSCLFFTKKKNRKMHFSAS